MTDSNLDEDNEFLRSSPPALPSSPTHHPLDGLDDDEFALDGQNPVRDPSEPASSNRSSSVPPSSPSMERIHASAVANHRKRPSEDMEQYADTVSRKVRLKSNHEEELRRFAGLSLPQQNIYICSLLMQNSEQLSLIHPSDAAYVLPTNLKLKIEKYSFVILVDPSMPAYLHDDVPVKHLTEFLLKYPGWGLTRGVMDDPTKMQAITSKMSLCLTHVRSQIKFEIEKSLGYANPKTKVTHLKLDILTLCEKIIALKHKVLPESKYL